MNPAAAEVCDANGLDEDCDGWIDPCRPDGGYELAAGFLTITGDTIGDLLGTVGAVGGDLNSDGYDDLVLGAELNSLGGSESGAVWVFFGPITASMSVSDADLTFTGDAAEGAGSGIAFMGDLDANGYDDLLIGAYGRDLRGHTNVGAAYLLLGPLTEGGGLAGGDSAFIIGEGPEDEAGCAVANAGDVDGDGNTDMLVGAYADDDAGGNAGAAYVVLGPFAGDEDLENADAKLTGERTADWAGGAVASAGDTDGDGFADILVGAEFNNAGASEAGAAYLVLGPPAGWIPLAAADAKLSGEEADDNLSVEGALVGAGDVNADGYDDILVGSRSNDRAADEAGAAYLVNGPVTGDVDVGSADAIRTGLREADFAGWRVAAGDVDADGYADLLIGAPQAEADVGVTYLIYGPASGTADLSAADARFIGESADDYAGYPVGMGDLDADGVSDLVFGAPETGGHIGTTYVLYGADL